jgi:hypothetical protein
VLAGGVAVLVHNCDVGEVRYGSNDLSKLAYERRMQGGISADQNIAVFEYRTANGGLERVIRANIPEGEHSEQIIDGILQSRGVQPGDVTRIYSERVPCSTPGHGCAGIVGRYARAGAKVSWSLSGSHTQNWAAILRIMSDGIA